MCIDVDYLITAATGLPCPGWLVAPWQVFVRVPSAETKLFQLLEDLAVGDQIFYTTVSQTGTWVPQFLGVQFKANLLDSVQHVLSKHCLQGLPLTALDVNFEVVNYRLQNGRKYVDMSNHESMQLSVNDYRKDTFGTRICSSEKINNLGCKLFTLRTWKNLPRIDVFHYRLCYHVSLK